MYYTVWDYVSPSFLKYKYRKLEITVPVDGRNNFLNFKNKHQVYKTSFIFSDIQILL